MAEGQDTGTVGAQVPVARSYSVKARGGHEVGTFFCILPEVVLSLQRRGMAAASDVKIFALRHGEPPREVDPGCYGTPYGAWKPAGQIPTVPKFVVETLEDTVSEETGPWTAPRQRRE